MQKNYPQFALNLWLNSKIIGNCNYYPQNKKIIGKCEKLWSTAKFMVKAKIFATLSKSKEPTSCKNYP